jgi:16S rRNA (cytosine1402-N4)-methyltransferase
MNNSHDLHISVLLQQSIDALNIKPNGVYIDATFGRGGHSKLILEYLNPSGRLLVIDQDPTAITVAQKLAAEDPRVLIYHGCFNQLITACERNHIKSVDGILFDLGVSSPQLDNPERGFSFNKNGPLDMRMDNSENSHCQFTAESWINSASEHEIADVLWHYGEEKYSRKISKAIILARKNTRITTTMQLAEIIKIAHPKWPKYKHPATQSFLAIRLFINQELEVLKQALDQSLTLLSVGARLVVISFHSLEDRIVKNFMRDHSDRNYCVTKTLKNTVRKLPLTDLELSKLSQFSQSSGLVLKIVQKAIKAGIIEEEQNIRSRSAILRVAESCGELQNENIIK